MLSHTTLKVRSGQEDDEAPDESESDIEDCIIVDVEVN